MKTNFRKNLPLLIISSVLVGLFVAAANGMESQDFVITLLRGLSVGSLTFLVSSGFSLIFGLLDVLNLAHGTLFMIGAYIGWTVYVRPDTFVDILTPLLLIVSGFLLKALWEKLALRLPEEGVFRKAIPWLGLVVSGTILLLVLRNYPIAIWDVEDYATSPVSISYMAGLGQNILSAPAVFEDGSPVVALLGLGIGSLLLAFSLSLFGGRRHIQNQTVPQSSWIKYAAVVLAGVLIFIFNTAITNFLSGLNTNWLFLIAVLVAVSGGAGLGSLMEATMIRPLYIRPIYQLMLTIGMSAIGIEMVRAIWGRPEFTMPRPELFASTGEGCPATSLADWWQYHCSTMLIADGRIRVLNEIFIPIVGIVVLVAVWVLLQRSRLGMVIRAGVQDREMVEALGINVRRVFNQVFALGVGLAALGGVLAAPSIGLSNVMGESYLLNALIALAIGGLTSFPGAALGSLLVGLLQQFIIKYGQIGIPIPFTDIVFKPSPPIVPASTILLMVVILLILPNGLLGKKE
ncbi:branched-chain amino acid ABC transporter permease [bacterium]|nr:branched-chain amino acid ABC transporter permease [bacterium]